MLRVKLFYLFKESVKTSLHVLEEMVQVSSLMLLDCGRDLQPEFSHKIVDTPAQWFIECITDTVAESISALYFRPFY